MIQTGYTGPRRSMLERAVAAARLDSGAYEEVEADRNATAQAAVVVAVAAVAEAIGMVRDGKVIPALIAAFLTWIVWSAATYFAGRTLFKGTATLGELLRTLGFAHAPGVLYAARVLPQVGELITALVAVWILIAGIIAIRQALDISTFKAVLTAIAGWLIVVVPIVAMTGAAASLGFW